MAADLPSLLSSLVRSMRESVRVAVVARVSSYDAAAQSCKATPLVRETRMVGGVRVEIEPVTLEGVPVVWPGGGGRSITMGLADGDLVLLIVRTQSHDEIDDGTTTTTTPALARRMDPADAIAVPAFTTTGQGRSDGQVTIEMPSGEAVHVGADASLWLAVSSYVDARLATIQAAHDSHVHPYVGLAPTVPGVTTPTTAPIGPLASVASDSIKVRS